jgi:hypothetical protein
MNTFERFGEAHHEFGSHVPGEILEGLWAVGDFEAGKIALVIDDYLLETPEKAYSPDFDIDAWEDAKQRIIGPANKQAFRRMYSHARCLMSGRHVTFPADGLTLLGVRRAA